MEHSEVTNACEICGGSSLRTLFVATDRNRNIDDRTFAIMQCTMCGTGCTRPKLSSEELSRYYTDEYYSLENNLALEEATRPYNHMRVKRIQRHVSGGRLMDIGAGTGMFIKTAREYGFEVVGLEISHAAATFGRDTWGLPLHQGNLHDTPLQSEAYDVVTLGHVYEHLHEPHDAARKLYSLLKSGGLLVVAIPNFASVQAKVFRSRWFHLDVPRHLFHYTPTSMRIVLERAGFTVRETNFFSSEHNWAGILGSVMKLSRPGESLPHKALRKAVGAPLARLLAFLESAADKGGTVEIYATKP